jgi:hypothetical protein
MALASHVPATWDTILSTTMHNYRKTLTDNIFGSRVLLDYFMSKGRVRTIDGGISIVEPLLLGSGEADSYGPWQQIQVNPVGGISAAQFPWKQLYATIIINGLEEAQNNGKEQAISLIEAKIMQAEETLKNILSSMLWGTRGGAAKATDFDPLTTLVDATAATGGITPAAAPAIENNWRSPTLNTTTMVGTDAKGVTIPAGTLPAAGSLDGAELERVLRRMFNLASDGGADHVDAIFGASDTFEAYEASLTPQVRYTDTSKANLGFQNLMFKNVPIFWDPDAPAGVALGLNSKYVGLTLHSERNFKQSPFTANLSGAVSAGSGVGTIGTASGTNGTVPGVPAASTIDARVSFITTYGNTTTRERRRNFKITAMTFT